jgi:ATP/maltotriose-dependent transcriptional regulator MalT
MADEAVSSPPFVGRVGDHVGLSVSLKARAQIAMDQRDYDLAETTLREAHRLLQGLNHTLEEIDVVLRLGQLSLARGDPASARGHVRDLEEKDLPTLRPDLLVEFEDLKRALAEKGGDGSAPGAPPRPDPTP